MRFKFQITFFNEWIHRLAKLMTNSHNFEITIFHNFNNFSQFFHNFNTELGSAHLNTSLACLNTSRIIIIIIITINITKYLRNYDYYWNVLIYPKLCIRNKNADVNKTKMAYQKLFVYILKHFRLGYEYTSLIISGYTQQISEKLEQEVSLS